VQTTLMWCQLRNTIHSGNCFKLELWGACFYGY